MATPLPDTWEEMEDRASQYARRAENAVAPLYLSQVDTQRAHALATVSLAYSRLAAIRRDRATVTPTLYFIGISPPASRVGQNNKVEFAVETRGDGTREPMLFTNQEWALRIAQDLHDEYPLHSYTVHPVLLVDTRVGE